MLGDKRTSHKVSRGLLEVKRGIARPFDALIMHIIGTQWYGESTKKW